MNSYRLKKIEEQILKIIVNRSPGKRNSIPVANEIVVTVPVLKTWINEIIKILEEGITFAEMTNNIMEYVEHERFWIVTLHNENTLVKNTTVYHHGYLSNLLEVQSEMGMKNVTIIWSQEITEKEYLHYKKH